MKCPLCDAQAVAGAQFCPQCGAKLPAEATDVAAVSAAGAPRGADSRPADARTADKSAPGTGPTGSRYRDVPEETLWEGSYSPKAMLGTMILAAVASVALLVGAIFFSTAMPLTVGLLAGIVLVWVVVAWRLAVNRLGKSYRLTTHMFYHREGVLTRTTDRIELIEIHDVTWRQGLIERLVDVGTVIITSADKTHGRLPLRGIEHVEAVADKIDKARRGEQVRRGRRIDFSSIDGQT